MDKNENILLQNWELPPFDKIRIEDYEPAIDVAISEAEANVEAIVNNPEPPTFDNTILALEHADLRLSRISALLFNLDECCTSVQMQDVVMAVQPKMTRLANRISTDQRLFKRVAKVYKQSEGFGFEEKKLTENSYKSFVRHGVALQGEASERYKRNAEELASLQLLFGKNALADRDRWFLHITNEDDLVGLPDSVVAAAKEEATSKNLEGWVFTLSAPSYIPFMTYSQRRDLREKMYKAYGSIGNRGNENDNNKTIHRIVELRKEQANLLGYDTYCDYILCERMVGSLANLRSFMARMHDATIHEAEKDLAMVSAEVSDMAAWDFSYYAERLKESKYSFDEEQLRPYFELTNVRSGIFNLYNRLYGLSFEETEVPIYHEDVKVYRVSRKGKEMGLLYLDMYPRESKRSGAWMTEFRSQAGDMRPQIQVVCNFTKPLGNTPSLLRFSEVETFMHEMGHAMHGMLSEVKYESMSGTNVQRDFVEMPSQVMENWCYEPEFLATFAKHYQTGEVIPQHYIDKIVAARNYLAAWYSLRQTNLGYIDLAFHTHDWENEKEPFSAERVEVGATTSLLPHVEGCNTATNFSHIFGGGYASGYYGYKWAEVLDADIFSRFKKDGIFNRDTAEEFREKILSRGGTVDAEHLFENFMQRPPDADALLKRMGLL